MLSHYMKPEDIRREFWPDLQRATYWWQKQSGGERGRARQVAKVIYGLYCGANVKRTDMGHYDSPKTGNQWMMWDMARMGSDGVEPNTFRACYYMTERYMGVMVPTSVTFDEDEKDMLGITIYTPHVFQRLHERLGVDMTDRLTVIRNFCENAVDSLIDKRPPRGDERHDQIVCRLPGSWLRGHIITIDGEYIIIYRTFYTDASLTPYQRRELQTFKMNADKVKDSGAFQRRAIKWRKSIY